MAGVAIGLGLFFFSQQIAVLAFSRNAAGVVPVLKIVSAFPALAVVTASMGMLIFIPFGMEKIYSKLLLSVGVVNVVLCFTLIPSMGAVGAAFGMVLMEAVQLGGAWYLLRRNGVQMSSTPAAPAVIVAMEEK
jgi:PST family polysaccharide transporter